MVGIFPAMFWCSNHRSMLKLNKFFGFEVWWFWLWKRSSPSQTLHAKIRFAPSGVECRPWHLLTWPESAQRAVYSVIYTGGLDRRNTCEDTIVHTTANECRGPCISIGLYFWECAFIGRKFLSSYEVANFWKSHLTSTDPCDFLGSQGAWKLEHAVWICAEKVMESTCLQEKSKIFWAETHIICQRTLEVFKCWKISNRTSRVAKCLASDFDRNILPETCIFQNGHNTNMTNPIWWF